VSGGATSGEDAPEIVTVYAVFGSAGEAQRIARIAVEERLAACANILAPCRSVYRWRGKIEEAEEVPALLKTRAEQAEPLIARIAELHSYELAAAVAWPIADALLGYAVWVDQESTG
jgi:periplasmic divalent cation tolerance protein